MMEKLNVNELISLNGGEIDITLDLNKLVEQINPIKLCYDFGHNVVYPYLYKPIKEALTK